jgi:hypothetical protein
MFKSNQMRVEQTQTPALRPRAEPLDKLSDEVRDKDPRQALALANKRQH